VDAAGVRVGECFAGTSDVVVVRAGEAADDGVLDDAGDGLHGLEVAVGRGGEAGLDDVDAELLELPRDADLLVTGHGGTGALLAVAERGVENHESVFAAHGFPEVALGILTGTGSQLLARIIVTAAPWISSCAAAPSHSQGALELGIVTELADDARARAIEIAEGLAAQSRMSVVGAKRAINRGANLPIEEGLRIEAEEWLKTIVTPEAMARMKDYVSQPFEARREWIRTHGVPPAAGGAIDG
jgi:hypothetical protein